MQETTWISSKEKQHDLHHSPRATHGMNGAKIRAVWDGSSSRRGHGPQVLPDPAINRRATVIQAAEESQKFNWAATLDIGLTWSLRPEGA